MKEIWVDIKGYEGKYQVSNTAKVKSLNFNNTGKEKLLKIVPDHYGHNMVTLSKNNKVENLEWCTKQQNILHRFRVLKQEPIRKYENINWNNKEDVNKYHRDYYYKHLEQKREYNRNYKRKHNKTTI